MHTKERMQYDQPPKDPAAIHDSTTLGCILSPNKAFLLWVAFVRYLTATTRQVMNKTISAPQPLPAPPFSQGPVLPSKHI